MGLKQCDGRNIYTPKPGSYDRQVVMVPLQFDFPQNIMKSMGANIIQQHQLKLGFSRPLGWLYRNPV